MLKTGGPQPPTTTRPTFASAADAGTSQPGRSAASMAPPVPLAARQGPRTAGSGRPRLDFVPPQRPAVAEDTHFAAPPVVVRNAVVLSADSRLSDVMPLLQKGAPGQVLAAHRRQDPGGGETILLRWENHRTASPRSTLRAAGAVTELMKQEWKKVHDVSRADMQWPVYAARDRFDVLAENLRAMVVDSANVRVFIGQANGIHRQVNQSLKATVAPTYADSLRAPADMSAHWLDALDQMRPTIRQIADREDPRVHAFLEMFNRARRDWIAVEHLTPEAGAAYFADCRRRCDAAGLEDLSRLAGHLHDEHARLVAALPVTGAAQDHEKDLESQTARFALARGNAASRVWESALMSKLVADPPPAMLHATGQLGNLLADHLSTLPPGVLLRVAQRVQDSAKKDARPWFSHAPVSNDFVGAEASRADRELMRLLRTPPTTGVECHPVYHLIGKLTHALNKVSPGHNTWAGSAQDKQDFDHIVDVRNRLDRPVPQTTGSGILLSHQPHRFADPYKDTPTHSNRPAVRYVPDAEVHPETLHLQLNGHTYSAGVSGSMLATAKLIGMLNDQAGAAGKPTIDARYAVLAELAFLVDDGGHAIHEALFALDMIRDQFDFGLIPPRTTPGPFMPDRQYFFDALLHEAEPATIQCLAAATRTAFDEMIAYRRHHVQPPAEIAATTEPAVAPHEDPR